jgi:hypothetical protein
VKNTLRTNKAASTNQLGTHLSYKTPTQCDFKQRDALPLLLFKRDLNKPLERFKPGVVTIE